MKPTVLSLLTLGLLMALAPFSIDTYLPAFPVMAQQLHTTVSAVAYSLTSFFLGLAVGQLLCGPLLDRFGRKKPLLAGLFLYSLAAVACAYVTEVHWLIGLRFVLAVGGCVGMVASRAMVRDLYQPQEIAGILSTLLLILGISPILAPTVGRLILELAGWRAIFLSMAFLSLSLMVLMVRTLPESKPADASISLRPRQILNEYIQVLSSSVFSVHALVAGLASAGLFSFIAGSPQILMDTYHFSQADFSYAFGFCAGGLVLGSQINRFAHQWKTTPELLRIAGRLQAGFALLLGLLGILDLLTAPLLLLLVFSYLLFHGFINPNATTLALLPFRQNAGSASALAGCLQMILGASFSALVSYFSDGSLLPMIIPMVLASWSGLGLQQLVVHHHASKALEGLPT
ncbi:Bcr/CflA family drug resistance efflux transporter [Siphonobacter sp. BAB-5405]|uniref:multidrug effflux MFS transporter n=1 Tax=Siphonobacter sp. BAB-5405 TaxID=1864825 RepID=UPI000C8013A7|nr:multidrug effflux MFS transporter [Siphonobacter sp. BAB-5405]PMD92334.1 Bcr/CflA family drug resistance efflux transporter [Siphonobacter sp. BAB-5405]